MENSLKEKQNKLSSMLERGMVMIYLDARKPGVRLPANLEAQAHVALNLSYRFSPPDLTVNVWGVRATLSFEGRPFLVAIPWSAIFAIRSHTTMEFWLFPEDVPEEFLETEEAQEEVPAKQGKRSTFQLVHSAPPKAEDEVSADSAISADSAVSAEGEVLEDSTKGEEEVLRKPRTTPPHLKLLH